jgi:FKBP-type peptidyl-prolyl cis-trans isomerase SlyD
MTQKETIVPGKYVELGYDLYEIAADGSEKLVHQTDLEDPEKIIFGITQGMIVPLEKAIEGLAVGEKFDVVAKCNEAFGPREDDQIAELDREIFEIDGKFDEEHICVGAVVPMMTADGYRISGIVTEVNNKKVKMDFNHPLAGKDIRFKGQIITVRDATPEELQPAQGCGCGGGCNCGDGGCGNGCNCN